MPIKLGEDQVPAVSIISDRCSGCLLCMLACSFLTTGRFSLSGAKLQVSLVEGTSGYMVGFLSDCTQCGLCADYCAYDVLKKLEAGKEAK